MKNTVYIFIDMYGVIIKESKGYFIPYTYEHFEQSEYDRIQKTFREEKLFGKAQRGELSSNEFLTRLGFADPETTMKDYLENYLTLDTGFCDFADKLIDKFKIVLLSNDVSEWSDYLTERHGLNKYFSAKYISGDIGIRKPDKEFFKYVLDDLKCEPEKCLFIDNSIKNLNAASSFGIKTILFNRDNVEYDGVSVNNFRELTQLLEKEAR